MDILGGISVETFLKEYWQKKPLLIRQALPSFEALIPADELAGMSLEEEVESRIILEQGDESPWQLKKGPFTEADFAKLPADKWTLLIQGVDQWLPEAADLLQEFNFLPSWRLDDLMISYAVDGGSVGPHYDQYDVFLLQAEGKREWRIGQMCSERSAFLTEPKLRILAEFQQEECWTLEPGDMLYLPPRLAHYGIAQGECMTYSIGFRAPSQSELLHSFIDNFDKSSDEDQRYQDPELSAQTNPGEISQQSLETARHFLQQALDNDALLADTLGLLMTEAKYPELAQESDPELEWQDIEQEMQQGDIERDLHSRFAFRENKAQAELIFYAAGKSQSLPEYTLPLIHYLCAQREYQGDELLGLCTTDEQRTLLLSLWRDNHLYGSA